MWLIQCYFLLVAFSFLIVLHKLCWQVAAPTVWNSLPAHLRSTLISRRQFRDGLKSHLFTGAYFWSSENICFKRVIYLLTYLHLKPVIDDHRRWCSVLLCYTTRVVPMMPMPGMPPVPVPPGWPPAPPAAAPARPAAPLPAAAAAAGAPPGPSRMLFPAAASVEVMFTDDEKTLLLWR